MSVRNTQWMQAKTPTDVVLEGVDVELDWDGSTVNSLIVRDGKGNALRILRGDYSAMRALVPTTVEKYQLKGVVLGVTIDQLYDKERDAEQRKDEITNELSDKAQLAIEKVRVPA